MAASVGFPQQADDAHCVREEGQPESSSSDNTGDIKVIDLFVPSFGYVSPMLKFGSSLAQIQSGMSNVSPNIPRRGRGGARLVGDRSESIWSICKNCNHT